jgi:CheY-like chemotaxis protein
MSAKRILLADDEEEIRDILQVFLAKRGFEVVCVGTGREAVTEAVRGRFDLILMDVMMPEMDGYHAAAAISERLGAERPKIVIMSSRNVETEKGIAVLSGAEGTLQKPFKLADVKTKIDELLGS